MSRSEKYQPRPVKSVGKVKGKFISRNTNCENYYGRLVFSGNYPGYIEKGSRSLNTSMQNFHEVKY